MAATYYQKLRASIAYNADYSLNCKVEGIEPLVLDFGMAAGEHTISTIRLSSYGTLSFYGETCSDFAPNERECEITLKWINKNFDKLFPNE